MNNCVTAVCIWHKEVVTMRTEMQECPALVLKLHATLLKGKRVRYLTSGGFVRIIGIGSLVNRYPGVVAVRPVPPVDSCLRPPEQKMADVTHLPCTSGEWTAARLISQVCIMVRSYHLLSSTLMYCTPSSGSPSGPKGYTIWDTPGVSAYHRTMVRQAEQADSWLTVSQAIATCALYYICTKMFTC